MAAALPNRRSFLKAGGALVVGFALGAPGATPGANALAAPAARGARPGPPDPKLIDTWLAVHADTTVTLYVGFVELGQGNATSLLQVAAEELDLGMDQMSVAQHDTAVTPNQGGTYSSASIQRGRPQVAQAAAEARALLLQRAAIRLDAPVDQLQVERGLIRVRGRPGTAIGYGELIGETPFEVAMSGTAALKDVDAYRLVGKPLPRIDLPDKAAGQYAYIQHQRLPGQLHGRVVRPRGQAAYASGARILAVDLQSIADIPGARVVRRGDFLGTVAPVEWDAVRAAARLKVQWEQPQRLPGSEALHAQMRADATHDREPVLRGDPPSAFAAAAKVAKQTVWGPYQAHAPFAPNCALADVRTDSALIVASSQDIYALRRSLAAVLGLSAEQIRVQYAPGAGTYGHSCYDDAAQAAALMSQLAGAPVRVQFMRWDEHGWDTFGPAHVGEVSAAASADGQLLAYEYHGWNHGWSLVETSAQLTGVPPVDWPASPVQGVSALDAGGMYAIPNVRLVDHRLDGARYLRGAWLRSPLDLSFSFASEQVIDQLAYQLQRDPYEFRRRNLKDARWTGVLDAVARSANWRAGVAAARSRRHGGKVRGRGIGLGTHLVSYGAAVADIEVDLATGKVSILHLHGAIDAGLAVNPASIESQITGQLVQTASRMLFEEVAFDEARVTSLDWSSYPILRFEDCPRVTPIVVQRMQERSTGAGEETMAAAAGAIANAFFDATGVRMQRYPLTPSRVLEALAGR